MTFTSTEETRVRSDEDWVADLRDGGPRGAAATKEAHAYLLRATRHQVARLRDLLPNVDAQEREDIAQQAANDALVSLLGKLDSFEGRSKFTTWAYKFGILHAGVAVRKQAWRHREFAVEDSLPIVDPDHGPEHISATSELAREVERIIATELTVHQRHVANALIIQEVPIDVLAERLGSTRNALYKSLHDVRRKIRTSLISNGYLEELDRSAS